MDWFELAKAIVRAEQLERTAYGHIRTGEGERLPETDMPLLLRPMRPQEPGVQGHASMSVLLCGLCRHELHDHN